MKQTLAEQIQHLTPTNELSFELIERLSKDNKFFIHKYETLDTTKALIEVSAEQLKTEYEAYDQVIEESSGHNAGYFEIQPLHHEDHRVDQLNQFMYAELMKLQPHSMLHFDGSDDTFDVYVVSK